MKFEKKININKIIIYLANNISDEIEIVINKIFVLDDSFSNEKIINEVNKHNPNLLKDEKNIGNIIKRYRKLEELINLFGKSYFGWISKNELNEGSVLKNYLGYYLKNTCAENKEIEIIETTENIDNQVHIDRLKSNNVKISEPVIYCE